MKQLNSKLSGDHSPMESLKSPRRRLLMSQVVLGGAAVLVLTACGGGSSDSTDDSRNLEAAYYRLKDGMTWDEAVAAVGWAPNYGDTSWHENGYLLSCTRATKVGSDIPYLAGAHVSHANGLNETRNFSF